MLPNEIARGRGSFPIRPGGQAALRSLSLLAGQDPLQPRPGSVQALEHVGRGTLGGSRRSDPGRFAGSGHEHQLLAALPGFTPSSMYPKLWELPVCLIPS
jgi:hypothetical protein